MAIWRLPVRIASGAKVRVPLDASNRTRVRNAAGSLVSITNYPDAQPDDGGMAFVRNAAGAIVPIAYEQEWFSMDFTTIARVKTSLGGITTTAQDTLLQQIVSDVSARMEKYMRRTVLRATQTQVVPFDRFATVYSLSCYPVQSVTSIKYTSQPNDFANVTAMDATSYWLEDADAGLVRFLVDMPLTNGRTPGYLKFVYVGGMADDTTDLVATYPALAKAADIQSAYEFQRRNTPGGNVNSDAGSTAFSKDMDFLEGVVRTLDSFRRHYIS